MSQQFDYLNVRIALSQTADLYDSVERHLHELINLLGPSQILVWYDQQQCPNVNKEQLISLILLLIQQRHSAGTITLPTAANYIYNLSLTETSADKLTLLINELLEKNESYFPLIPDDWRKNAICNKAIHIIDTQYQELTLEHTAATLNLNPSYLSSSLARNTGASFLKLLHSRRILAFVELCTDQSKNSLSVENIAINIGYSTPHHFWRVFKRYTNISPSAARKILKDNSVGDSLYVI